PHTFHATKGSTWVEVADVHCRWTHDPLGVGVGSTGQCVRPGHVRPGGIRRRCLPMAAAQRPTPPGRPGAPARRILPACCPFLPPKPSRSPGGEERPPPTLRRAPPLVRRGGPPRRNGAGSPSFPDRASR